MKRFEAHLPEKMKNELDDPNLPAVGFAKHWPELRPEFFDPLPEDELALWNGEGD